MQSLILSDCFKIIFEIFVLICLPFNHCSNMIIPTAPLLTTSPQLRPTLDTIVLQWRACGRGDAVATRRAAVRVMLPPLLAWSSACKLPARASCSCITRLSMAVQALVAHVWSKQLCVYYTEPPPPPPAYIQSYARRLLGRGSNAQMKGPTVVDAAVPALPAPPFTLAITLHLSQLLTLQHGAGACGCTRIKLQCHSVSVQTRASALPAVVPAPPPSSCRRMRLPLCVPPAAAPM